MTGSRLAEHRIAPPRHAVMARRTAAPARSSIQHPPKPRLWWRILRTVLGAVARVILTLIFIVVSALLPFVLLGLAVNYADRKFSVALVNLVLNLGPP
jgi:hypothetical protein